jgi:hypothetical protein
MAGVSGERLSKAELEEIRTMVLAGRTGPRAQSEAAQVLGSLQAGSTSVLRRTWRRKLRAWKREKALAPA